MKDEVIKESKKNKEIQFAHRFYRKISKFISPFFVKLGISPNQITIMSFIVILIGSILLSSGIHNKILFGVILIQIGIILDFVDGDVARSKGLSSILGNWLDCMFDRLSDFVILVAIVISVTNNPGHLYDILAFVGLENYIVNTILFLGLLFVSLRFLVDSTYAYTLLYIPKANKIYHDTKKSVLMEFVFSRITFIYFLLLIFGVFGILPLYFLFMLIYLIMWYPALLLALFLKVRKINNHS